MKWYTRSHLYFALDVVGSVLAAAEAGFLAAGHQPKALAIALAVYGALSARGHGLARRHVTRPDAGAQDG